MKTVDQRLIELALQAQDCAHYFEDAMQNEGSFRGVKNISGRVAVFDDEEVNIQPLFDLVELLRREPRARGRGL